MSVSARTGVSECEKRLDPIEQASCSNNLISHDLIDDLEQTYQKPSLELW